MNKIDQFALLKISEGKLTPFYVYDLNQVRINFDEINKAFAEKCQIFYSMKCNPHPRILSWFAQQEKATIDVSSLQELKTTLHCNISPDRISFVGPGKSDEEITYSLSQNVGYLVIESISELKKALEFTEKITTKTRLLIRVALRKIYTLGGRKQENYPTQFGISEDDLDEAFKIYQSRQKRNIELVGLHCFVQSQQLNVDHIMLNFKSAFDLHYRITKKFGIKLPVLNLGGGLGVPYFSDQRALDTEDFLKKWTALYNEEIVKYPDGLKLFIESGRYLLANAGNFYTQILYRKNTYGREYAICDGGMTQNAMAIGFGQNIRRNFLVTKLSCDDSQIDLEKYTLVGPSCYKIDILATDILLPRLGEGDILKIHNCGAYGPSFSPQDFLSRPHAMEFFFEETI